MRLVSLLLVVLTAAAVLLIYRPYTDPLMGQMALLHLALIGGLLGLFAFGQIHWSYDALRIRHRTERAQHERETMQRDAEAASRERALREREAQLQTQANAGIAPVAPAHDAPVQPARPFWRR